MRLKKIGFIGLLLLGTNAHSQQLVRASGNVQLVTTAGTKIVINGGITFLGTSSLTSTADSIYLFKTTASSPEGWLDSTVAGAMNIASTGNVFFRGGFLQSFYGKTRFYNLFIRNTVGDTLLSSCEVRNVLNLDTGFVFTRSGYGKDSLLVSNTATAAILSTSNFTKSWVDGRLSRIANIATTVTPPPISPFYLFPVGKTDSLYAPVKMAKLNSTTTTYTAEYWAAQPYDYLNIFSPPVDHISRVEYWEITSNAASDLDDDGYLSLSWRGHSQVSSLLSVRDSLLVAQYLNRPGYTWDVPGGWVTGRALGPDSLQGYVTSNASAMVFNDSSQRRFALATYSKYNALPINLLYFTALADGNKVRLNWDVANEESTLYYEVEKSLTATGFSHLLTKTSLQQSRSQYADYDYSPATGWNFYRIKIVNKSGSFTYSPVRAVKFDKGLEEVKIFPNPAITVLNIQLPSSYAGKVSLQVYAADGKYISSMKPNVSTIQLNVLPLPAGTYILKLTKDNGDITTYPFIKQ
jgi:hypothetical protein